MSPDSALSRDSDYCRELPDVDDYVAKLRGDGYCLVHGLFEQSQVDRALALVADQERKLSGAAFSNPASLARGDRYVQNLHNKDPFFLEMVLGSRLLMNLLGLFLNDPWYKNIPSDKANFILRSFVAKAGMTTQPLHLDTFLPHTGKVPAMMQVIVALEDQTVENGCVRVVPGSHLSGEYAREEARAHAVPVEYRAGDAVLIDSRIWHGGGENTTNRSRWMLIAAFCQWWHKQAFDPKSLPVEIYQSLSDEQKAIVGFCSIPPRTEFESLSCKRGFECLPDRPDD